MKLRYVKIRPADSTNKRWHILVKACFVTTNERLRIGRNSNGIAYDSEGFALNDAITIENDIKRNGKIKPEYYVYHAGGFSFHKFAETWIESKKKICRESTYKQYSFRLKKILDFWGNKDIRYCTDEDFIQFVNGLDGEDWTIKRYIDTTQSIFLAAGKWRRIQDTPNPPKFRVRKKIKKISSQGQVRLILSRIDEWDRKIFIFIFYTGCRECEARKLRWKDWEGIVAYIHDTKEGVDKKIRLDLFYDIPDMLEKMKKERRAKPDDYVFIDVKGKPYYAMELWRILQSAKKGLSENTGHVLGRAGFIRRCADAGIKLHEIAELVGHRNIKTTQGYLGKIDIETIGLERVKKKKVKGE